MTFFAYPISFAHPAPPPEPAQLSWTYIYTPAKVFAMDICGEKESSRMGTYFSVRETHIPSFGGGMFLRAGDVYSFVRRRYIPSSGRRVFIRSKDVYSFGRETFIPRTGAHVPLGLVCRCHSDWCAGATRASG